MEIRSVPSIPANRPVASVAAASATAYSAPPSSATGASGDRSDGGFISPVLRYDQIARVAVLYYRDTDSGETKDQIPAERVVEEYRRNAVRVSAGSNDSSERTNASSSAFSSGGSGNADTAAPSYASASDGAFNAGSAPAAFTGYTASPAPGGFSGAGASVSGGASSGGAPGGLVSVTV